MKSLRRIIDDVTKDVEGIGDTTQGAEIETKNYNLLSIAKLLSGWNQNSCFFSLQIAGHLQG